MYSYHNTIKKRIKAGELLTHYYADNYPGIGNAMVLVFKTNPVFRPIRVKKWEEYKALLNTIKTEVYCDVSDNS